MGQCVTCRQFLPPDFLDTLDEAAHVQRCHFCIQDKAIIFVGDNAFVKTDVVQDYKVFIQNLKENASLKDKIRDLMVEGAVKKNV